MPAVFQKVMDYTLVELKNTHCFHDDTIVVSRGFEHLKLVYQWLKKPHEDNFRINLPRRRFTKTDIKWLGHTISESGISQKNNKSWPI